MTTILHSLTDPKTLTDDDLDQLRRDVLSEQERRANLTAIPAQIAALANTYRSGGGDEQTLTNALGEEPANG